MISTMTSVGYSVMGDHREVQLLVLEFQLHLQLGCRYALSFPPLGLQSVFAKPRIIGVGLAFTHGLGT
jgi:hypothetical protein